MASLDDRLRAYNKRSTAGSNSFNRQNTDAVIDVSEHARHPVSLTVLELAIKLTLDFRGEIDAEKLLFFDLESTGLGSSEQVYPFLIGAANLVGKKVSLTTLFAPTPAGEETILRNFIEIASNKILVSFNGKSFDLPLILRRCSKYNLPHGLSNLIHIDLYHLIRRIYPEKPARLADAESRLLGFSRADDLSGAEVAQAYFESLRFGRDDLTQKILHHNIVDVLSLVSLTQKIHHAFSEARAGHNSWAYKIYRDKSANIADRKQLLQSAGQNQLDSRDQYALAKIHRREKNYLLAGRYFCRSYRNGYPLAIVDLVRILLRRKKTFSAARIARYGMNREAENVQRQLVRYIS
jgi:uncharacterized protein